jgi:hypothetical protein
LFHEPTLLGATLDTCVDCYRANKALHAELAGQSQDNRIEGHEGDVFGSFAELCNVANMRWEGICAFDGRWVGVGEEDRWVQRIVLAGGDIVGAEDC